MTSVSPEDRVTRNRRKGGCLWVLIPPRQKNCFSHLNLLSFHEDKNLMKASAFHLKRTIASFQGKLLCWLIPPLCWLLGWWTRRSPSSLHPQRCRAGCGWAGGCSSPRSAAPFPRGSRSPQPGPASPRPEGDHRERVRTGPLSGDPQNISVCLQMYERAPQSEKLKLKSFYLFESLFAFDSIFELK